MRLPPLRERKTDIPDLVRHFLKKAGDKNFNIKSLDVDALKRMQDYDWPGNVRELENLVHRVCALYTDKLITSNIIDIELKQGALTTNREDFDNDRLATAVEKHLVRYFEAHGSHLPSSGLSW